MPHTCVGVGLLIAAGLTISCGAPQSSSTPPPVRQDILLARDADTIEARVPANATLETLLRRHELSADLTAGLIDAVRSVFNPRELRANQVYQLTRSVDGIFREFKYQIDSGRLLRVAWREHAGADGERPPGLFEAEVLPLPMEIALETVSIAISEDHPSLVAALERAGENVQLALQLAEIFGGEIDFNSDLQQGDRFDVLFERATRDGEFVEYGDVAAALVTTSDRRITAFRFAGADGKASWYDEDGRSLRRQFLQSPLPFDPRVTSRFSYRRLHPVHGSVRPHLGVDYGAPYGTAVKAAATGRVELAGWAGGAGRMVRLRHAGGYQTAYLHLSSIASRIRPGAYVEQGDLIGRVGSSGTATGPHLDYRIIKNGRYVNPLVELKRLPKGDPIPADQRAAFEEARDAALAKLK